MDSPDDSPALMRKKIADLHEWLERKNMVKDDEKLIAIRLGILKAIMNYVPMNVRAPE